MTARHAMPFQTLTRSAIAAVLLTSCATNALAARADDGGEKARAALSKGKVDKALSAAEAAVAATPRDAALRALLGQVYVQSGRFQSAAQAFDDAMTLGDNTARTALNLALAKIGAGDSAGALVLLDDWRAEIPASDLGLAIALAGQPERGVMILSDAIRGGENTPKMRQNLAYTYAMAGRWREARMMAAQDVPGDKLGARLTEWAMTIQPVQSVERVAAVLGVRPVADRGLPAALALADDAAPAQLAVQAPTVEAPAPAAPVAEVPVLAVAEPVAPAPLPAPEPVALPAEPAPTQRFSAQPMIQAIPAASPVAPPRARVAVAAAPPRVKVAAATAPVRPRAVIAARIPSAKPTVVAGTHLVQVGSFSTEQGARRAWGYYSAKSPQLAAYRMVITPAQVNGRKVWRVAAAGVQGRSAANGLCGALKAKGGACFAYAAPRVTPMGGGARLARR